MFSLFAGFILPPNSLHAAPPTPTPTAEYATEVSVTLTLQENQSFSLQQVASRDDLTAPESIEIEVLEFPPELPAKALPFQSVSPLKIAADGLVDGWQKVYDEDFEGQFPDFPPCFRSSVPSNGLFLTWGKSTFKAHEGDWAGWPARGGVDGLDPATNNYPANLDSRLRCGPFNPGQSETFLIRFSRWLEIYDSDDNFSVGVSTDGFTYTFVKAYGVQDWVKYNLKVNGLSGQSELWVMWRFESDSDNNTAQGAWIDDLEVWQYHPPALACGNLDPGNKGLVLPPYDPTANLTVPTIRAGDTLALQQLVSAKVNWVRLGFIQQNGIVEIRDYDRMVDSLCAQGISVLGLVNDETLLRQDFNDPANAAAYRQEFAGKVAELGQHYKGRITYWEVWNEPNFDPDANDPLNAPFTAPERYAPLLNDTYNAIKSTNPQAQVLFGGLSSAWGDSHDYFAEVYRILDDNLGQARPFDYFAVHPYANIQYGPNPAVYMYGVDQPWHNNIIDKFTERMFIRNDGHKKIWVTEIGWNSAKGSPIRPTCHDPVLVTETEQAAYLKPAFDTLFNEVKLWNQPSIAAIDKVIWYQYMDVGITDPCTTGQIIGQQTLSSHAYAPATTLLPAGSGVAWSFGLYRGDKVSSKPVWCEFTAYPQTCIQLFKYKLHLPAIIKD